ncbi:hypothetical protein [Aquimarina rubra]|uniref:DUF3606 domain-containing protein n=1 Tax=Aquimarina rubra TaxID=1920033 RepID=A0ABW5LFW9_9FLAO
MNTSTTSSKTYDDGQPLVEVARESDQEKGDIRREIQQLPRGY